MTMTIAFPPPARRGRTALPGRGRSLSWSEWGSPEGRPILFFPGAATASALSFGAEVLDRLGLRLVALDRPGLAGSDPAPDRTLLDWADDVRAFLAARGLGRPGLVGYSQGGPFALACAAVGLGHRAAIVAGTDELAASPFAASLAPGVSDLVARVREDPGAAQAFFAGMTATTMRRMVLDGSSPHDRAVFGDASFEAAYTRALEEALAPGAAGYARDTVLSMSPWPFAPERIAVPVGLWYGALDASPVHSPDLGRSLAARIPGARLHVVADAGGSILWTHAEPILRSFTAG